MCTASDTILKDFFCIINKSLLRIKVQTVGTVRIGMSFIVMLTVADEEAFEDNPDEYIRRDIEGSGW